MERYHIYKLGVAILFYAAYYRRPLAVYGLSTNRQDRSSDEIVFYQGVQGKPGVDFPIYARIPRTTFNCKEVTSGYYADLETDCQVFHICNDGAKISFLCPNGTIFQQSDLICEWWFKVNCTNSPSLYEESAEQLREQTVRRKNLRKVSNDEQDSSVRKKPQHYDRSSVATSDKQTRTNGRHVNRNYKEKEIIRIKQIPAQRGGRRNFAAERKVPEQSSEETQIPEETASYFKTNQNAIHNPIKTSTVTYANHRPTYSDIQDPTYYYPKSNSHTISPLSPQTYSTNQVPLNNGKPYVVTTPKSSTDRKTYSPSITEAFKYSPTVPPFTTTKKPKTTTFVRQSKPIGYKFNNYDNSAQPDFGGVSHTGQFNVAAQTPSPPTTVKNFLISGSSGSDDHRQISRQSDTGDYNFPGDQYHPNQGEQTAALNGVTEGADAKPKNATTKAHSSHYCSIAFDSDRSNHTHEPHSSTTESNFNSDARKGSAIPDHQIVIGRPKLTFNDLFTRPTTVPNVKKISLSSKHKAPGGVTKPDTKPDVFRINLNENLETNGFYVTNRRGSETVTPSSRGFTAPNLPKISTLSSGNFSSSSERAISSTPSSFEDNSINFDGNRISSTSFDGLFPSDDSVAPNLWSKVDANVREFSTPRSLSEPQFTNSNTYLPKIATSPRSIVENSPSKSDLQTSSGVAQAIAGDLSHGPILKPKPFELPPKEIGETSRLATDAPDSNPIVNYEVSSARPFGFDDRGATAAPTQPTPYTTDSSTYDHLNNMINTLRKIVSENNTDSSRPGLVIPPSAGPQTLHSLAVYFASALDGIATPESAQPPSDVDETQAINELLTRSTLNRYRDLFKDDDDAVMTTAFPNDDDYSNDLEAQHSKNPTVTPRVRQLAQVFTKALSSYLDDPDTFRKVLQEVRPTEPPLSSSPPTERNDDDELLNYSDADIKPELPRLTTTPSVSPTWGYILAPNNSDSYEHNSLNSDGENLQSADSQSFVSQFNNLVKNKHFGQTTPLNDDKERPLPNDHWTTSSDVAKLWQNAIYTSPLNINKHLEDTTTTAPIDPTEFTEINYEVRSLPKLELNSTQVHGILIDFMHSNNDSNKLQRILSKLNTTQAEFLEKMREIEQNPLTRRLILLLISECGSNITNVEARLGLAPEALEEASSNSPKIFDASNPAQDKFEKSSSPFQTYVDPSLTDENEDTRALQLLNSLYTIASRYGK